MGELLAFRLPKGGRRSNPAPDQTGAIVFFPGVRREQMADSAGPAKRSRRGLPKRPGKSGGKSGAARVNDTVSGG